MRFGRTKAKPAYQYDPAVHGISQSMIQTRLDCTEKARLNIVLGLSPKHVGRPLVWGTLFHGALEGYRRDLQAQTSTDDSVYYMNAEFNFWKEHERTTDMNDLVEECMAEIEAVFPFYRKFHSKEDHSYEWIKVEEEFAIHVLGHDMPPMVGKFDGVVKKGKKVGILETKTKSMWPDNLVDLLPLDLQLAYYITALNANKLNRPSFVRYDLIRRPLLRRGKEEALKTFTDRIVEDVRKRPAWYFQRVPIDLTQEDLDLARGRTIQYMLEFYEWWRNVDAGSRCLSWNAGHCENRYGTCPFLQICAHDDRTNFQVRDRPSPELKAKS